MGASGRCDGIITGVCGPRGQWDDLITGVCRPRGRWVDLITGVCGPRGQWADLITGVWKKEAAPDVLVACLVVPVYRQRGLTLRPASCCPILHVT